MANSRRLIVLGLSFSALLWAASEYSDYLAALSAKESGNKPASVNPYGFLGSYQMGESALIDAGYYQKDPTPNVNDWQGSWTGKNGIYSKTDFLANASGQTQAISDYNNKQWSMIQTLGLDSYVGQTVGGMLLTESGLLAGAHLVGVGGLRSFLKSNGTVLPSDANHTAITQYIAAFNGFNIAAITGNTTSGGNSVSGMQNPQAGKHQPSLSTAFASGAGGISFQNIKTAIQSIIAILLFLWTAFVTWGQFKLWGDNGISMMGMQTNILRASVVMLLLMFIFMT
ncbi:TIGR03758 family integrating conjugative element protein [Methylomonas albis]|uniref:TIGR03758 family integrating conjugative element protein n=1 Tax=Methylomonas albis TaxID=1854563 RepID=A0ABR9D316_9GAMM|nr:TIGR03758 family integrating conjugative element protein [Methylomonas albis]MBD9357325.1 TIGR03758 family integrating conjugative element protein [Methylomonas albis]